MLVVNRRKKHGVDFREVWYAEEKCGLDGIILYRGAKKPIGRVLREVRTLITDLTQSEEEIVAKCQKDCRYQIRRAARENITAEFKVGSEITEQDIAQFCEFFIEFWKTKGITDEKYEKYKEEIETYAREGVFAITCAKQGGQTLVYHTYIVGDTFVRSYQSASQFRSEAVSARIVGIANRYLHKADMMYFKEMGKTTYDWGGAGLREEVKNITEFKESFGGDELYYYDCEDVVGLKAEAVKGVINLIGVLTDD
ncbi:MAG: hypothetical protein J6C33_01845 [Lachnospiraceae bacterium]|nr:hypothetical protein [Lachnospiraceae bacterium]